MAYRQRQVLFDGIKTIDPWDLDSNKGWTPLTGTGATTALDMYYERVPWLFRGVNDRALNVANLPWSIFLDKTERATSEKWDNEPVDDLNWLSNPRRLFLQIEKSLAVHARAYIYLTVNPAGYIKSARYVAPSTITEEYDKKTGDIIAYTRTVNGSTLKCTPAGKPLVKDQGVIVAIYEPDHNTEIGPSNSSSVLAALSAAGVLLAIDTFSEKFIERGAIKASILSVETGSESEHQRLQRWWEDVISGVKNAWSAVIFRGKMTAPIVVGEGLESLQNDNLTTARRQDIATALGVPESRMWSAAANYATRDADEKAYFRGVIIPEFDMIAEALNSQVFIDMYHLGGYRIENRHESLDIFQTEESDRAASLGSFMDFLIKCPTYEIAKESAKTFGYELTEDLLRALEAWYLKKEERANGVTENVTGAVNDNKQEAQGELDDEQQNQLNADQRKELDIWRRKAIKAVKGGGAADCEFTVSTLRDEMTTRIHAGLINAKTVEDVKYVFDAEQSVNVKVNNIARLADELQRRMKPSADDAKKTAAELRAWQRQAVRQMKAGKKPGGFDSEYIPAALSGAIEGQLEEAVTRDAVDQIFMDAIEGIDGRS